MNGMQSSLIAPKGMMMQYGDLIYVCDEYLKGVQSATSRNWSALICHCPSLSQYASYEQFFHGFKIKDLDGEKQPLYADLGKAVSPTNIDIQIFMELLFAKKLRQIARFAYTHFWFHPIIEDVWEIILDKFSLVSNEYKPIFPSTKVLLDKTRNKVTCHVRRRANEIKSYMANTDQRSIISKDIQHDVICHNEIMDILKERMSNDEYNALCIRLRYEFYDRGKNKIHIHVKRNMPTERRAIKKARRILSEFYKIAE